jgi:hypothetical protein
MVPLFPIPTFPEILPALSGYFSKYNGKGSFSFQKNTEMVVVFSMN